MYVILTPIDLSYSECDLQISSIHVTWDFVRNLNSWPHPTLLISSFAGGDKEHEG